MPWVSSPCSPRLSPWSAVTSDERAGELAPLLERAQQAPELRVHERDLAVVGRAAKRAANSPGGS